MWSTVFAVDKLAFSRDGWSVHGPRASALYTRALRGCVRGRGLKILVRVTPDLNVPLCTISVVCV